MPPIEIDKILSDPLLIVAAVLLVVSPVLFLVALVKYIRAPRREEFAIPHHDFHSPLPPHVTGAAAEENLQGLGVEPVDAPVETPAPAVEPEPAPAPAVTAATETSPDVGDLAPPLPMAPGQPRLEPASDRTIVMPPGMAEMQGEMEIAFSQLKTLNKRVHEMEAQIRALHKELARVQAEKGGDSGGDKPMPL